MSDLVQRLRRAADRSPNYATDTLMDEAADEIERLNKMIARLQAGVVAMMQEPE